MKHPSRVVLLANGLLVDPGYARSLLRDDDLVIAANGGTRVARELGRVPDLLIGDVDSLADELRGWLEAAAVPVRGHPPAKDQSDLELALAHAIELAPARLLLLGATGGRVDMTVANLSLLALLAPTPIEVELVVGREHLYLVRARLDLEGEPGQILSILPWGGDAHGVRTRGLRWPLRGESLRFGPARGISNVIVEATVVIEVETGLLLVSHHRAPPR